MAYNRYSHRREELSQRKLARLKDNPKDALRYYRNLLEEDPDDFTTLNNIAYAHIQLEDWENAREVLDKILKREPDDILGHINLAICIDGSGGDSAERDAALDKAEELAKAKLAEWEEKKKQHEAEGGDEEFEEEDGDKELHTFLAGAYAFRGDREKALEHLRQGWCDRSMLEQKAFEKFAEDEEFKQTVSENLGSDEEKQEPVIKWADQEKIGRNDPCPCGSGRKVKKCDCGFAEKMGL
jgi:tetratricopeptide (TPR) repeat protein